MTAPRTTALDALLVDATLVEIVSALHAAGIRPVLLKGPAVAQWLYPTDPEHRPYGDVDLFVSPDRWDETGAILRRRGFIPWDDEMRDNEAAAHADTWTRRQPFPGAVDLHRFPAQVRVDPATAWSVLHPRTVPITVSSLQLEALDTAGRALVVALHMTHHVGREARPREDLRRALEVVTPTEWAEAAALAEALGCSAQLSGGLRCFEAGARIADDLGLPIPPWLDADFVDGTRAMKMPGPAALARVDGTRAKLGVLVSELFPSPQSMRHNDPLGKRGPLGLAAAYLLRPLRLARMVPRAITQYRLELSIEQEPSDTLGARLVRAAWAASALRRARKMLLTGELADVRLPSAVGIPGGNRGIVRVLETGRASCLESALVRQTWLAAHGEHRDVVIGVTAPGDGFRAHAWLDGDPEDVSSFTEITRHRPR